MKTLWNDTSKENIVPISSLFLSYVICLFFTGWLLWPVGDKGWVSTSCAFLGANVYRKHKGTHSADVVTFVSPAGKENILSRQSHSFDCAQVGWSLFWTSFLTRPWRLRIKLTVCLEVQFCSAGNAGETNFKTDKGSIFLKLSCFTFHLKEYIDLFFYSENGLIFKPTDKAFNRWSLSFSSNISLM